MNQKYIVWSYCDEERQTFEDIVLAATPEQAKRRVAKARPYAIVDRDIEPMPLADHIRMLERELADPADGFLIIEEAAR